MTCIGNSGPLDDSVAEPIEKGDLVVCGVLSGNRNFEGRIHPLTRANYLASPPLVIAYAIAGTVSIDFETQPIGKWCLGLGEILGSYLESQLFHRSKLQLFWGPD